MASGQSYAAVVRARNDGSQLWPKGVTKLGCRLFKVTNYTHDNPNELQEEVPIRDVRAILLKDCKPGEIAEFARRPEPVAARQGALSRAGSRTIPGAISSDSIYSTARSGSPRSIRIPSTA